MGAAARSPGSACSAFIVYATWAAFRNGNYYAGTVRTAATTSRRSTRRVSPTLPTGRYVWGRSRWRLVAISPALLILDLPAGLPGHLLLLPQDLLPLVLALAAGLRGRRRRLDRARRAAQPLHRRDPLPADPAEHPPLLLVLRGALRRHLDLGRDRRRFASRTASGWASARSIFVVNAVFIWAYTLGCHACRHLCGGGLKQLSKSPGAALVLEEHLPKLNEHHQLFAWLLADLDRRDATSTSGSSRPARIHTTRGSSDGRVRNPRLRRPRSSAPAAPGFVPRSRRTRSAPAPRSSASRSSARPTP